MNCPSCQNEILSPWRYCTRCGASLRGGGASESEHHVTVVVSDLQGSTALAERLDPESLRYVLDQYFDELGSILESHGGRIEKRIGDAMVTVFGLPAARDDDALRAVRAVAECQATLAGLNDRLERTWGVRLTNRTGVSSGPIVFAEAGGGHRVLAGSALELASRLEPVAPPLEALLSESTVHEVGYAATTDALALVTLKNGTEVSAARLISVEGAADASDRSAADASDRCASCEEPIDLTAVPPWSWCPQCATPVMTGTAKQASRRTLTIVFADLHPAEGSPGDDDARRQAMVRAFEELRGVLEHHGATVEKFIGDAVMAVFGLAQRREDDALRAIRAALEMQEAVERVNPVLDAELGVRLELRIGVNTGPVIAGDPRLGQRLVTGDAVNVAARLEQTANLGQVVIGGLTRRLVGGAATLEELEPLTLKGKAEPVPAFRVASVSSGQAAHARLELPLVGRDAELTTLMGAWAAAVDLRRCQRVRVRGDTGIGKSRLVYELIDRLPRSARVLRGGCLSYGEGITFWPVVELIQAASGVGSSVAREDARAAMAALVDEPGAADRLWSLAGVGDRQYPVAEYFWAVRAMLATLARNQPLLIVVDGLHWAEPTLMELLDDLVANLPDAPVLLVTMERPPEGGETDADGASEEAIEPDAGPDNAGWLDLDPLDDAAADQVIAAALGQAALPARLVERVKRAAAGNPLFIEQFLTMLIDDGLLVTQDGAWTVTADLEHVKVPPTIEAVLAARVDALEDDERSTLEPASVMGREFPSIAINDLLDVPVDTDATLVTLIRRQLVVVARDPDILADYRFRNLLLRDVVYDGLLKRTRSGLHQRFADWLETFSASAGRSMEVEEILGYHFEQAYQLRASLGAMDDEAVKLGNRAADRLAPAGLRAFARGDMPAAANLLHRAAETLPDDEPTRPRLLARAAEARLETGAFREAIRLYDQAESVALGAGDTVASGIAELGRFRVRYNTGDGVTDADARELIERVTPIFEAAGDHRALAACSRLLSNVDFTHSQYRAAGRAVEQMIEHARKAGDQLLEFRGLPSLAMAALYGPTPVPEAIERCHEVLTQVGDDRSARAATERYLADLLAFDGRFEEAREKAVAARARLIELGWHFDAAIVSLSLGPIELLAGRPDDAVRELRAGYDTLKAMGERNFITTVGAFLAEAVRRQGHLDEALELAAESATGAADDDAATQITWRQARSKALIDPGSADEAKRLIGEAVAMALETDDLAKQGDTFMDQAEVLTRRGARDEARTSLEAALERYRAKGHRVGVRLALEALSALETPVGLPTS